MHLKFDINKCNLHQQLINIVSNVSVMDPTTASGFTPEYTARKFVDAIVEKKKELILSQFLPRLGIFLRHATPSIYFWLMARRANKTC